jgi:hypothetical protein
MALAEALEPGLLGLPSDPEAAAEALAWLDAHLASLHAR